MLCRRSPLLTPVCTTAANEKCRAIVILFNISNKFKLREYGLPPHRQAERTRVGVVTQTF